MTQWMIFAGGESRLVSNRHVVWMGGLCEKPQANHGRGLAGIL